jgi:hypothetical protein
VDAEEYVDFLKVGYKIVFDDMIAADKVCAVRECGS